MTLEETLASLKEAFTGKSAEAETHAAALAAKETELATALATIESLKGNETALAAKVTALEAELSGAKASAEAALAAKLAAEAKIESAGKKAAEIAASVGVDPVEVSPVESAAKTPQEVTEQWVKMRAAAKTRSEQKAASDFYEQNRSIILKSAGL